MVNFSSSIHPEGGGGGVGQAACTAEVCQGALGHSCFVYFLPDDKHLSRVEKCAFANVLSEAAQSRI